MASIFLYSGEANQADIRLRDPTAIPSSNVTDAGQIASAEAFGSPTLSVDVVAAGIATAEAFGAVALSAGVAAAGITTAEGFGSASLGAQVSAAGIVSAEAFGVPGGTAEIVAAGIPSSESFGDAVVTAVPQALSGTSGKRKRDIGWRPWEPKEPEPEVCAEVPKQSGPNALAGCKQQAYFDGLQRQFAAIKEKQRDAEEARDIARTRAAISKAIAQKIAADKARAAIEQEIEESDVAYVAMMLAEM